MQKAKEESSKKLKTKRNADADLDDDQNFAGYTEEQQEMLAYDAWKDHLYNNRSIIVDLFQG